MSLCFKIVLIFLFLLYAKCGIRIENGDESPLVNITRLGLLRGKVGKSYFTGRKIYQFFGINYAKAPSGERRFKPPEEFQGWSGVYNATKMRQRCPQIDMTYYPSPNPEWLDVKDDKEDCLVLNVFTPCINCEQPTMPVMFYIHGGSFYLGSAYDFLPDFLLEEEVVLVVAQYRLGPLGFLCLDSREIPGNMGMMDIVLALRWVKNHITNFGGDPTRITVFGQSAGGAAASSLLISPLVEEGLIDKMIVQSGSILGTWTVDENPLQSARMIAEILGCETNGTKEMTECLKTANASEIVRAHYKYVTNDIISGGRGLGGNSLVVQGTGTNKYLTKSPHVAFAEGENIKIPVMAGTTRDEGASFLPIFYDTRKLSNISDEKYFERNVTKDVLEFFGYKDPHGLLTDAYHNMYFTAGQAQTLNDMLPGLVDICGVLLLKESTYNFLRTASYGSKTYAYSFNFYGNISKLRYSEPNWDSEYPFPTGNYLEQTSMTCTARQ